MPEDPKWMINTRIRYKYNTRHRQASCQNGVAMLLKPEQNGLNISARGSINDIIIICNARLHNLKNVTIKIPKNQHIVITWNTTGFINLAIKKSAVTTALPLRNFLKGIQSLLMPHHPNELSGHFVWEWLITHHHKIPFCPEFIGKDFSSQSAEL